MERRGPSETSHGNIFSEVVPASLASITPILHVDNEIETRSLRNITGKMTIFLLKQVAELYVGLVFK